MANAAALAEWPDGSEVEVGTRRERRSSGTRVRSGRGRCHTRLAPWLVSTLVTASDISPRVAPRRAAGDPVADSSPASAIHSVE